MPDSASNYESEPHIFLLAPRIADAETLSRIIDAIGKSAKIVTLDELESSLAPATGILLCTQEAISHRLISILKKVVANQPTWSQLPLLVLVDSDVDSTSLRKAFEDISAGNVLSILRKPIQSIEFLTGLESALSLKRRQLEIRKHLEFQRELQHELNHRIKNTFAVCHAIFQMSLRQSSDLDDLAKRFSSRLRSLTDVHDLLHSSGRARGVFSEIVQMVLEPYVSDIATQTTMDGPVASLDREDSLSFALILNELATNASKYGALSRQNGTVDIAWDIEGDDFRFWWREIGGPRVRKPQRSGYGTKFINASVQRLSGTIETKYEDTGFETTITCPANLFSN
jgi:two-component sensor histidine kinase